jgi:pSer/pThr/pTyr-binding forkhead associated (FHA) protein
MKVKMLVVQGRPAGKSLVFPLGDYYFGRGTECHVRPNSEWVSRQHCLLRVTSHGAFLRDLGSRNGTLVNGALLNEERLLTHGDQVQVGPLVFEVQLDIETTGRRPTATIPPRKTDLAPPSKTTDTGVSSFDSTDNLPILPPDLLPPEE